MSSNNSPSMEKLWFQDTKTGCEKQAHYFVQIRKLQDELIHREQHNLINAMDRLKQLSYPRKRPMIRNVGTTSDHSSTQQFPARHLNLRKVAKHKALLPKDKPDLSAISGKPLVSKEVKKKELQNCDHRNYFVMPRPLTDRDIAKIVHHANATFPSKPCTYLLQPHLPSIPNVGRKIDSAVDNRLRLLTLAESEFCEPEEDIVHVPASRARKRLDPEKSHDRKRTPRNSAHLNVSKENQLNKRSRNNVLMFDVDPNDPSLFSHCVREKTQEEQHERTPLPPPNSRPSTAKSRASQLTLEINAQDGSAVETSEELCTIIGAAEKKLPKPQNEGDVIAPAQDEMSGLSKEDHKMYVSIPVEQMTENQSPIEPSVTHYK